MGALNTVIDFGLLLLLSLAGMGVIAANYVSTGAALSFSFIANRNYTFARSGRDERIVRQMALFIIVTLFGLWVLQPLVFLVIDKLITVDNALFIILSKVAATVVSLAWNYFTYSRLVFTHKGN